MSLRYSLIPEDVKDAFAIYLRAKQNMGECFETGVAFGQLLAKIEHARLDLRPTIACLRKETNV